MIMKNNIILYIEKQKIDKIALCQHLKISIEKMNMNSSVDWTADELLSVCQYLHIDPWHFYNVD